MLEHVGFLLPVWLLGAPLALGIVDLMQAQMALREMPAPIVPVSPAGIAPTA